MLARCADDLERLGRMVSGGRVCSAPRTCRVATGAQQALVLPIRGHSAGNMKTSALLYADETYAINRCIYDMDEQGNVEDIATGQISGIVIHDANGK